jgi:RNA polymerase sigma factor (sigma-70 family)
MDKTRVVIEVAHRRTATDAEVIAQSLREPERFFELFDRHYRALHRFLRGRGAGDAADDLSAEAFLVAFRRRDRYDQSRENARPWLFGIAINLARNERRSERRRLRAMLRETDRPVEPQGRVLERLDAATLPLAEALADLTADERDVLLLYACEELSYDEVAEAVGAPVGTVRSRLHRARAKVRAKLELKEGVRTDER